MNVFGHAVVAAWRADDAKFVLGAMLPDLERMAGGVAHVADPATRAGVRWHHRTDAAFHASASFGELASAGRSFLQAAGVQRGAALAVAHVGVEILIDGELGREDTAVQRFRDGLGSRAAATVSWDSESAARQFALVRAHLSGPHIPLDYRDPHKVTARLVRVLAPHPRLRIRPDEHPEIERWLGVVAPAVADRIPELLADLRTAL